MARQSKSFMDTLKVAVEVGHMIIINKIFLKDLHIYKKVTSHSFSVHVKSVFKIICIAWKIIINYN